MANIPFSRMPVIILSHDNKDLAKPGELYLDFPNKKIYAKSSDNTEIDFLEEFKNSLSNIDVSKISGTLPTSKGGTGLASLTPSTMLFVSEINTLSEVNTTAFGRSLLTAQENVPFSGLNVLTVNGKTVDDTSITDASLWTAFKVKKYVDEAFSANDAFVMKGILGDNAGMVQLLPATGYSAGWSYKVGQNGKTYAGAICEIGDMVVAVKDYVEGTASSEDWMVLQSNSDGSLISIASSGSTRYHIPMFADDSGKVISDSGMVIPEGTLVGSKADLNSRYRIAVFGDSPNEILNSGLEVDIVNQKILGLDVDIATGELPGIVKSSDDDNKIKVEADGSMIINKITLDKLDLNGGGGSSGSFGVSNGGTGVTAPAAGNLLYYTSGDAYSLLASTAFGRGLLSMVSGTMKEGLNVDQVDGRHAYQLQTLTLAGAVQSNNVISKIDSDSRYRFRIEGNDALETAVSFADKAAALTATLPIDKGGTGSINAADARTALGITPANIGAVADSYIPTFQSLLDGKAPVVHTHLYAGSASAGGPATTTLLLNSARTIAISGGATGTATSFNGGANISIPITALDASKLTGTIDIARLPKAAVERLHIVASDTERFALTTAIVQTGDTVKVTATGLMYYIVDDTNLSTGVGYEIYTAGAASSVPWSGILDKPSTYTPDIHDHLYAGSASAGGPAATALALNTARTIAISGGATGTATSFNGGANITIPITALDMGSATAGTLAVARGGTGNSSVDSTPVASSTKMATSGGIFARLAEKAPLASPTFSGIVTALGGITSGPIEIFAGSPFIDFHFANSVADYTTRLIESASGALTCSGTFTATKVYNAVFNDYAEWFEKENKEDLFEPGDILSYSKNGVVKSSEKNCNLAVGVCSNTYGHILGGVQLDNMEDNIKTHVPIGLCGRVNVKVTGKVSKGDLIVTSDIRGVGIVNNSASIGTVLGKAISEKASDGIGIIKIMIMNV